MNNQSDLSQFKPTKQKLSVFAPISIGNISVGFDSLGLALSPIALDNNRRDNPAPENQNINKQSITNQKKLIGDIVHISVSSKDDSLSNQGSYRHVLPDNVKENIVWQALLNFNSAFISGGGRPVKVSLILEKNIPINSGLGSSSCSIVAALVALNEFYSRPFNEKQLLIMMGELERVITGSVHYDNLAPCYLGGLQLMLSEDFDKICQSVPAFDDCFWIIAYPDIEVSTRKAREVLPKEYPIKTMIRSCQNIAGFIDASYRQDQKQAFSLLTDQIAEPYREPLLNNYKKTKEKLMEVGSLAVGISGSGPTIFSAADSLPLAIKIKEVMIEQYATSKNSIVEICKVDSVGARLI